MRGKQLRHEVSDVEVQNQVPPLGVAGAAHRSTRTLDAARLTPPALPAAEFTLVPTPIRVPGDISPGELYEDCSFHPCLCLTADGYDISGVSLVDGSYPRSCDIGACGVRKLSLEEARTWKLSGPQDLDAGSEVTADKRWW